MAKRKRTRRTPEQMIADLQKKIAEVERRAKAKELKKESEATKLATDGLRTIAKGMSIAKEEGNTELRAALVDAHESIAEYLRSQGLTIPKPRGRRKGTATG